ncbi:MAG: NAD(P)-dependent oxidoreductase [Oricola sp.]
MRVLLTGGTGFIGSWVAAELDARGHSLRIFDHGPRPEALDRIAPGLSAKTEFVVGDIRDAAAVATAAGGCDAIIHLVGIMTVDCARDPRRGAEINLLGSVNVFEAALAAGIRRIAYLSSAAVYSPNDPVNPEPMSHYGTYKLAVEGCARSYCLERGLPSTGFRPSIVYGPGESSGISAGPSIACRAAALGEESEIRFSGRVGFVHVADVARAIVGSIEAGDEVVRVFDLNGVTAGVDEFVSELVRQEPASRTKVTGEPLRIPAQLNGGDSADWFDALPVTPIAEGIERTIAHYRGVAGVDGGRCVAP